MKKFKIFGLLVVLATGGGLMFGVAHIGANAVGGVVPQPTPRRAVDRPRSNTTIRPINTNSNVGFIGGSDDGSSIRRRPVNSNHNVNTTGPGGPLAPAIANTNTATPRSRKTTVKPKTSIAQPTTPKNWKAEIPEEIEDVNVRTRRSGSQVNGERSAGTTSSRSPGATSNNQTRTNRSTTPNRPKRRPKVKQ